MDTALEFGDPVQQADWTSESVAMQPFAEQEYAEADVTVPAAEDPTCEQQLAAIQLQRQQYQDWIVQYIAGTVQQITAHSTSGNASAEQAAAEEASTASPDATADKVTGLLTSLHANAASRSYIAALKAAADQVSGMLQAVTQTR